MRTVPLARISVYVLVTCASAIVATGLFLGSFDSNLTRKQQDHQIDIPLSEMESDISVLHVAKKEGESRAISAVQMRLFINAALMSALYLNRPDLFVDKDLELLRDVCEYIEQDSFSEKLNLDNTIFHLNILRFLSTQGTQAP